MLLKSIDPETNRYRFYQITVQQSLFGGYILTRSWGRIGSKNFREMSQVFDDPDEMEWVINLLVRRRLRHDYLNV